MGYINLLLKTGKIINIIINSDDTILTLKYKIMDMEGIHPDQQVLYYNNSELDDLKMLSEYNLLANSIIYFRPYLNYTIDSSIKPILYPKDTHFNKGFDKN